MKHLLLILCMLVAVAANAQQLTKKEFSDLKSRADKGEYAAQCDYAFAIATGNGCKAEESKGMDMLQQLIVAYPDSNYAPYLLGMANLTAKETDTVQAILLLKRAADMGYRAAMNTLGFSYLTGDFTDQDYAMADRYYTMSIATGSSTALYYKGEMIYHGLGCDFDHAKALEYYNRAYALESPMAAGRLGDLYLVGEPNLVDVDLAKSAECYRNAVKWDAPAFNIGLGNVYQIAGDTAQADYYYNEAVKAGNLDAYESAAVMYGDNNHAKCMEWLERGTKAGNHYCAYMLGWMLENQEKPDYKKAAECYALDTNAASCYRLGCLYANQRLGKPSQQNFDKGIDLIVKAAVMGNLDASYDLAKVYTSGTAYCQADPAKAAYYYQVLADSNVAEAQYMLGRFYEDGYGVPADESKALYYLREAADQGHNGARCWLGDFYRIGQMVEKNQKTAFAYYMSAAENDSPAGLYYVGRSYMEGCGVDIDTNAAVPYLQKAAAYGVPAASDKLANIYNWGTLDIVGNGDSAIYYYHKAAQEGNGHSCYVMADYLLRRDQAAAAVDYLMAGCRDNSEDCMVLLGRCMQEGVGFKKAEPDTAYLFFELAASRFGNAEAYYQMGLARMQGIGCMADEALGKAYLDTAANKGYAAAMYTLGQCYVHGWGCSEDTDLALYWIRKAASLDNVRAINTLAAMYAEGEGVDKDEAKAFELYTHGAQDLGSLESLTMLGSCYEHGIGCILNSQTAVELYTQAAEHGYAKAMYRLAAYYDQDYYIDGDEDDIHIEGDPAKAQEWLVKAAEAGYVYAQYTLAERYENGSSLVKIDLKQAKKYYTMAAEQGYEPAKAALNRIK